MSSNMRLIRCMTGHAWNMKGCTASLRKKALEKRSLPSMNRRKMSDIAEINET